METLLLALQRADQGHGQVVSVVGEAAVGKSRLFHEFINSQHCEAWTILQAASVSYGKATTYLSVIDLLKVYFDVQDRDDLALIHSKLVGKIRKLDITLESTIVPLLALMDVSSGDAVWQALDPPQRRRRTLDALKQLFLKESQVRPLLLVFEDLHWIDSETQTLLDSVVQSLPSARILLLTNYRREYQHGWGGKTYYTQLPLQALPPDSAVELLEGLLGQDSGLEALKRRLIKTAEGNPFFLEESVRTLVESGVLQGDRGVYRLTQQVSAIQVPTSVHSLLAARIDRLSPDVKHLLQVASVIGKDVPFALLQAVADQQEEDLHRELGELQWAEFIYQMQPVPDLEYTFKHALTHEVAYGSLLGDHRRHLHAQILAAMERLYRERLSEHTERLAYHAYRGEVWDEAARYCREAGVRATARSVNREALTWFEQARQAVDRMPVTPDTVGHTIDLCLEIRDPLFALGELERVAQVLNEARGLAEPLGDNYRLARVLSYFTPFYNWTSQPRLAVPSATRALALVEGTEHVDVKAATLTFLGLTSVYTADFSRAGEAFTRNIALLSGELRLRRFGMNALPGAYSRGLLGFVLAEQGQFGQALRIGQEAIEVAAEAKHPFSETAATCLLAHTHYRRGDLSIAVEVGEHALDLSSASENQIAHAFACAFLSGAYAGAGQVEKARSCAQRAEQLFADMRASLGQRQARCVLVEAHLKAGALDLALELATATLELVRASGQRLLEVWLLNLIGEIHARWDPPELERAQDAFIDAMTLATDLGMRPSLAHAELGLGRVLTRMGKAEQACNRFTAALTSYRAMDMRTWPELVETELRAIVPK